MGFAVVYSRVFDIFRQERFDPVGTRFVGRAHDVSEQLHELPVLLFAFRQRPAVTARVPATRVRTACRRPEPSAVSAARRTVAFVQRVHHPVHQY